MVSLNIFKDQSFKHLVPTLTKQEMIIAECIIDGHTSNEIADILSLSTRTVRFHIRNLKDKFYCKTLAHLGFTLGMIVGLQEDWGATEVTKTIH